MAQGRPGKRVLRSAARVVLAAFLTLLCVLSGDVAAYADPSYTLSNNGLSVTFSGTPAGQSAAPSGSFPGVNSIVQWMCGTTVVTQDTPNPYGVFPQAFNFAARSATTYGNSGCVISGGYAWTSVRLVADNSGGTPLAVVVNTGPPGPSTSLPCGSGTFSDLKASYVDSNLWVSWRWVGQNTDSQAYPTFMLTNASESVTYVLGAVYTAPGGVIASAAADGYYMYGRGPVAASNPGASLHLYFVKNSGSALCKQVFAFSTSVQITPGPSSSGPTDYGSSTDPDTSTSCSAWDLYCRLKAAVKWAFYPTQSLQQWSSIKTNAETHVPVSLIIGGSAWISTGVSTLQAPNCNAVGVPVGACATAIHAPHSADRSDASAPSIDVLDSAGDLMQDNTIGHLVYDVVQVGIYGACLFSLWKTTSASFGGKGAAE